MDSIEISALFKNFKDSKVAFKAVLPPSGNIARLISAFGNTEGGYIILGVTQNQSGLSIHGLSSDFRVSEIVHQAIDKVAPRPTVSYDYITFNSTQLFAIKVEPSPESLMVDGTAFKRVGQGEVAVNSVPVVFKSTGYTRISEIGEKIKAIRTGSTTSKSRILDHFQSILKMFDDLGNSLYPVNPSEPTENPEGKILSRLLFASIVDGFEAYLSDLLYEIYLARPETLKSNATATIEEVLNCNDMQEFVKYVARQKIQKIQRGSVAGFIKENAQISSLRVLEEDVVNAIEGIFQIRHLFTHRNGIVDERFLKFCPSPLLPGNEFKLSVADTCTKLEYLIDVIHKIDTSSIKTYNLDNN